KSPRLPILIMNVKRFLAYGVVRLLAEDGNDNLLNFFAINARTKDQAKHRVFADRYDSLIIQSQKLFLEKLNYIHNNPCQPSWKLAKEPEQYKYSSSANYILGKGHYDVEIIEW
ncbi:MAG: hypothetical protein NTW06_01435, partial [Candidatus Falkowbacteria bacterium]|nr:hypothetical protein [Candidatus Falkowbacteria bacterium]